LHSMMIVSASLTSGVGNVRLTIKPIGIGSGGSSEWSEHNGFIFDQKGDKATSLKMVNQILFIK
jgi:hypothetical protein